MLDYLLAPLLIFLVLGLWIKIQQLCHHFADRHPQYGPAKEESHGCNTHCLIKTGQCQQQPDPKTSGD